MVNTFNTFLRKYFQYPNSDEQEIRSHIYKNKLTNDISGLVTIGKNTFLRLKFRADLIVSEGDIILVVTPVYFEEARAELKEALCDNLRKNLTTDKIIIGEPIEVDVTRFNLFRSVVL